MAIHIYWLTFIPAIIFIFIEPFWIERCVYWIVDSHNTSKIIYNRNIIINRAVLVLINMLIIYEIGGSEILLWPFTFFFTLGIDPVSKYFDCFSQWHRDFSDFIPLVSIILFLLLMKFIILQPKWKYKMLVKTTSIIISILVPIILYIIWCYELQQAGAWKNIVYVSYYIDG